MSVLLRRVAAGEIPSVRRSAVDDRTLAEAGEIVHAVRGEGEPALRRFGEWFGELGPDDALVIEGAELKRAVDGVSREDVALLERTGERIERFARAQRESVREVEVDIPGGKAGQSIVPVERAGCYAPGGRFPLPSSVLMTAVTARVAGVGEVLVASPRPAAISKAAAAVAGADALLLVGGAHAIAAMAYGVGPVGACDAIVGPGNRWVTAAKQLVSGSVRIDMLAGPSELVVLADRSADARTVAADLLAQAEHDTDASAILVTTSEELAEEVERELSEQLATLPTAETARAALANGYAVVVESIEEGIGVCDRIAPEHLEVMTEDAAGVAARLRHYGGLFVGSRSAEVLGDYGAGPNHTLPTGGTARSFGGLSVFDFLRVRTWLRIDDAHASQELVRDAVSLGRHEGLEGHARSGERRITLG